MNLEEHIKRRYIQNMRSEMDNPREDSREDLIEKLCFLEAVCETMLDDIPCILEDFTDDFLAKRKGWLNEKSENVDCKDRQIHRASGDR